ncbi:MAG: 1-acyl-sn-glycerol-3-phosphate acyltransferase [Myxococcales bacterium]|nr:1-acyl-sn-glycerol-3-phosphate acyltransferase [Myxococcales bacterium]
MTTRRYSEQLPVPLRALGVVVSAFMFTAFFVGGAILSWLVLPLVSLYMWRRSDKERILGFQRVVAPTYRLSMSSMRWFGSSTFNHNAYKLDLENPTVVIANHPTLIDTPAFLAVEPNLICIVKGSFAANMVFTRTLRYCGHVLADGAEEIIAQATDRLEMGFSVLVFPEGTRSPPGELGRLHRGAFEMAKQANVPVLPVVVTCSPPMLTHGVPWHRRPVPPASYELHPGQAASMSQWKGNSRKAATHHQEMFRGALAQPATAAA